MRIVAYMAILRLLHFYLFIYLYNYLFIYCWRVPGLLGLVHKVQQRTMRVYHEDAHYCAKNYKNLRHYVVMVKQKLIEAGCTASVVFASSDDKAKVCVTIEFRDRCGCRQSTC